MRRGTTYSLIEAEPTVSSVLAAIRKGQVRVVNHPLTLWQLVGIALGLGLGSSWERVGAAEGDETLQSVTGFNIWCSND